MAWRKGSSLGKSSLPLPVFTMIASFFIYRSGQVGSVTGPPESGALKGVAACKDRGNLSGHVLRMYRIIEERESRGRRTSGIK